MEILEKDRHSSLLQTFVNYGRKKFYNIGARVSTIPLKIILSSLLRHGTQKMIVRSSYRKVLNWCPAPLHRRENFIK
jgi:hypothetical protein